MKRFLKNISSFLFYLGLIFCIFLGCYIYFYQQIKWENAILPIEISENDDYDLLILGASSAGNIAERYDYKKNHNLSMQSLHSTGGGLLIQQLYLEYFFKKRNTAKNIIFFIHPVMLYTSQWDGPNVCRLQRFDFDFVFSMFRKFGLRWTFDYLLEYRRHMKDTQMVFKKERKPVTSIDSTIINARITLVYGKGAGRDYPKQKETLLTNIKLILENHKEGNLIFCLPPTLLGDAEPYREEMLDFLEKMKIEYNIPYYDYSSIYNDVSNYKYFVDYDHLNEEGVSEFLNTHILSLLKK